MSPASPSNDPARPTPSVGRRLARFGLIGLVFVVVAAAGLYRAPSPESWPLEVSELFEKLESARDEVNVVFIGSSYLGYHISNEIMREEAAEHGFEMHPLHLDLPALEAFEADAMLEWVLEMQPPNLRWIVIEYSEWDPEVIEESFRGSRLTWWQTPERTRRLIEAAWADAKDDDDRDDALPLIARAVYQLARNHSRIGGASEADRERNQTMTEAKREAYSQQQLGKQFIPKYMDRLVGHREARQENEGWKSADDSLLRAFEGRAIADQIRRIREAGYEPVYLVPPSLIRKGVRPDATILDFDDPDVYPDFYDPSNRIDPGHMTESQVEPFSRLVGRALAEIATGAGNAADEDAAVVSDPADTEAAIEPGETVLADTPSHDTEPAGDPEEFDGGEPGEANETADTGEASDP